MGDLSALVRELIAANLHTVGQNGVLIAHGDLRPQLDINRMPLGDFFDSTPIIFYTDCPPQYIYYMDRGKLARDTRTLDLGAGKQNLC